jgi:hypothetical protein
MAEMIGVQALGISTKPLQAFLHSCMISAAAAARA